MCARVTRAATPSTLDSVRLHPVMRASKRDYYETLGVGRSATESEIKAAYRRLVIKVHPDHNPNNAAAEESFKEITEAYAVLSDVEKRQRYDHLGHAAFNGGAGAGPADFGGITEILEGFFDEMFGRKSGSDRLPKDLQYNLEVSFDEAALGAEKTIEYERRERCDRCQGKRAEPTAAAPECPACRGR